MIKRILPLILSLILIISVIPAANAADVTPLIMVSGFGATTLAENGEAVFPPSMDKVSEALGFSDDLTLEEIITGFGDYMQEGGDVKQLSAIVSKIVEPIRLNPDGSSVYDVRPIVSGAENTSYADFRENDMLKYIPYTGSEFLDMESVAARIGEENVFNFMYDWRADYDIVADEFKEYIDDVLRLTGAKKVSIYSVSQGCLVVGQYLFKYSDLKQTDKVVFDTPVLGGTTFATDLFTPGEADFNMNVILSLLSDILHTELDLTGLTDIAESEYVVNLINAIKDPVLLPALKSCIAFWQLVPIEDFESHWPAILTEEENAEVLNAVRNFHKGFMGNITETFEKATDNGATVSIKACTGFDLVTDSDVYSDSIVDMRYSTGAVCAPYGEAFPEDYVQAVDNGKNSISPDRTIDLSAGYWPDRTWVVNGLFHGQVEWCEKSLGLVEELLFTDNIKDAYSSYEYPQFMQSHSPTSDLTANFISTNNGFLLLDDGRTDYTLEIKNVSNKNSFIISDISCSAVNIELETNKVTLPGETLYFTVSADKVGSGKLNITYADIKKPFDSSVKSLGISVIDSYCGKTVSDDMPENEKTPNILKLVFGFVTELFITIKTLLDI